VRIATLFDPVPPFQSQSVTSIEAAQSVIGKTQNLRDRVLGLLRLGPLTDEQIAIKLNLSPNTARPRRIELCQQGKIHQVGVTTASSGRRAALWGIPASMGKSA
jgi:predicted ArsR family transcriptional regulator